MKKFLLSCLAVAGMFFSGNAQTPVTFVVDGTTYEVTSSTTVSISEGNTTAAEVVIPETVSNGGTTYTVTAVGERAFNYAEATTITLPNTVTEIGYCGIYNTKATTIQLSTGLTTLGENALAYNKSLTSITIPEGVKEIPSSCFSNNQMMATVNLPATIESIGNGSFYKVPVESFTFPANCRVVGKNVFQLAPNLKEVTLNANLESMGEGVFRNCVNLTKVNLEAATKLKEIPENCFVECNSLADITIPANVKKIGMNAFGKTAIAEYKIASGNKAFTAKDGCVYAADMSIIWLYPAKKAGDSYTIPDGVRGIGGGAFYGAAVKTVTLPESIVAIDSYAFCESTVESVNLPNSILQIGEQAFASTNLTELVLPEKILAIYDGLAAWSKKLKSVTIPADVRLLANHAFQLCTGLTSITCKGGVAPEIQTYWDDSDNPFGYVDCSLVTLHIPKGSLQSYKDMGWTDIFSNIVESEPAVFMPTSTTPANEDVVKSLGNVELTFSEAATVAVAKPKVELRRGSEIIGEVLDPVGGWVAENNSSDKMTVTIFPAGNNSEVLPLALEANQPYFLIIPAGTFKNAAGELNQKIVITVTGAVPPFVPVAFSPESNSQLSEINAIAVKFNEETMVTDRMPQITLKKDDATTGQTVSPENGWLVEKVAGEGKTVTITPIDYGYQPAPLALEPGATYYMTIPAGLFKNLNNGTNEEIQLVYVGKDNGSVKSLEAGKCLVYVSNGNINVSVQGLGTCDVAAYDLTGRCVATTATDNSTVLSVENSGLYIVNVVTEGKTLTFKVKK